MTLRVALVAGPDPGHAYNAIGLAAALVRRGHHVTVATGTRHRDAIEAEGGRFVELPLLAPTAGDADLGHRLWGRAAQMAPPLASLLRGSRPDVVVVDVLTRAGAFAAELLDRPWVELSPHHLYDPDPDVPPVGLGRPPARGRRRRRSDDRIRRAQAASVAAGATLETAARRAAGLPTTGGRPEARLLATLPALELPRRRWPAGAHVVGPIAWEPRWRPLTPPPGDAPLVVVTDSTASTIERSLARRALRGLRHADVRLVVTTGRSDLAGEAHAGAVVGRGPHGPLLDRAAVAVGPGGGGFVGKALTRGVPLVLVPLLGDQRETGGRVRHAGVGVAVASRWASATVLRLAVERVLADPAFRDRAGAVADDARRRGLGPDRAAELVEAAAAGRVPPASAPTGAAPATP